MIRSTLLLLALTALVQEGRIRHGGYRAELDEKSALGSLREQCKRFDWPRSWIKDKDPKDGTYELTDEAFRVFVPEAYDGSAPWGLLVWISPGPSGEVPSEWHEALARHKLIAIGADDSGNSRLIWYRCALALDAARGGMEMFEIDRERVYLCGFSGGGRVASRLAFHYPEVFRGGIYMGGCNFYRQLESPSQKGAFWRKDFPKPTGARFRRLRKENRHVVFAGEHCGNNEQSQVIYAEMVRDKFAHVSWLEEPGAGHDYASAPFLSKALEALDRPLKERRERARKKSERSKSGTPKKAGDSERERP